MDEINSKLRFFNSKIQSTNIHEVISFFEKILSTNFQSFDNFCQVLQTTLKKSACRFSWGDTTRVICCRNCERSSNGCICIPCFMAGNHQGHDIYISKSDIGTCDCGNCFQWNPHGFCKHHQGIDANQEDNELEPDIKTSLIAITKYFIQNYFYNQYCTNDNINAILQWLEEITSFGDATRRCVVLGFIDSFKIYESFQRFSQLNDEIIASYNIFIGTLINDPLFMPFYTQNVIVNMPKIINFVFTSTAESDNEETPLFSFFHATAFPSVSEAISSNCDESIQSIKETIASSYSNVYSSLTVDEFQQNFCGAILDLTYDLSTNTIKCLTQSEKAEDFVDFLSSVLIKYELFAPFSHQYSRVSAEQDQILVFTTLYDLTGLGLLIKERKFFSTKPLNRLYNFFNSPVFKNLDINFKGDTPIYHHSVLSPQTEITQSFLHHLHAYEVLNLSQKPLIEYIQETTNDANTFILNWALIPLRFLVSVELRGQRFFRNNSDDVISVLREFKNPKIIEKKFVPTFSLIQNLLLSTSDIDSFLLMIIKTFVDFDPSFIRSYLFEYNDNINNIYLSLFYFLCCLLFDRLCIENDILTIRRLMVISLLKIEDQNVNFIINSFFDNPSSVDSRFFTDLQCYATTSIVNETPVYHLVNQSEWYPLLPFNKTKLIYRLITMFLYKNHDALINFPELPQSSIPCLFSPVLFALEFHLLSNAILKDNQILRQLIYNVLIITSNKCQEYYKSPIMNEQVDPIKITNFDELVRQNKSMNFYQFIQQKFIYLTEEPLSIVDIIQNSGAIGLTVLNRMNIPEFKIQQSINDKDLKAKAEMNKQRSKEIKQNLLSFFAKTQNEFASLNGFADCDDEETVLECSVCREKDEEDDHYVYPAIIYQTPLASFLKSKKNQSKKQQSTFSSYKSVQICLHPIHPKCIDNIIQNDFYSCPIERYPRNAYLPILATNDQKSNDYDGIQAQISTDQRFNNLICDFFVRYYSDDSNKQIEYFKSELELLEANHRTNPHYLDKSEVSASFRNLYLCIWSKLTQNASGLLHSNELNHRIKTIAEYVSDSQKWTDLKKCHHSLSSLPDVLENKELSFRTILQKYNELVSRNNVLRSQTSLEDSLTLFEYDAVSKYILYSISLKDPNSDIDMNAFISGTYQYTPDESGLFIRDESIINEFSTQTNLYEFLRCARIFDYIARCKYDINDFNFDWDYLLSVDSLCKYYKIQRSRLGEINPDVASLPLILFIDLPKSFLEFINEPYNFNILDEQSRTALDLLTGKVLPATDIFDHVNNTFDGSFSIFLMLSGWDATKVYLLYAPEDKAIPLNGFYVNYLGIQDPGIAMGYIPNEDELKKQNTINEVLMGAWTPFLA